MTQSYTVGANQISNLPHSRYRRAKPSKEKYRFSDAAQGFLRHHEAFIKPSTLSRYESILTSHILPSFCDTELCLMDSDMLEEYAEYLRCEGKTSGGGLSEKTVRDIISLIFLILDFAAERGHASSVTRRITLPRPPKKAVEILSAEHQEILEQHIRENICPQALGIYIALYTGLRIGEICALKWDSIDLGDRVIYVRSTVQRIKRQNGDAKTEVIIGTPKSDSSERAIPIPEFLACMLAAFKCDADAYFLTSSQRVTEPRVYYRQYQRMLGKCGLPDYTFHALRHTFATRAVELGFDSKTVSELLGHAGVKLTLERYVHPSLALKRSYMDKLQPKMS